MITIGYVQVFDDIEKANLRAISISVLAELSYRLEIRQTSSVPSFAIDSPTCNGSWIADGFANSAIRACSLASFVVVLLLWAIDDATRGLPVGAASLLFLIPQ